MTVQIRNAARRRRWMLGVALAALLPVVAAPAVLRAVASADTDVTPISHVPANRPAEGLWYDGLTPAKEGEPCVGGYRVADRHTCTHGPDKPPPGLDVNREVAPVAPAVAQPVPARDTGAAPTDADLTSENGGTLGAGDTPALVPDAAPGSAGFTIGASGVACDGDGVTGKRVQVLYVHGADKASRFGTYQASFQNWAAGVDAIYDSSAQETGGSRHIRFVTTADCQVDVREVEVSASAMADFTATIRALAGLGYNRTDRKYMIFGDTKVYCGIGSFGGDQKLGLTNRSNGGPSYGRSDSGCWSPSVAAHELGHNLGAVNDSAPNSSKAGHCLDEYDVMCYNDSGGLKTHIVCPDRAHDQRLDCNHDDYYNTNPSPGSYLATHWNVADNDFLIRGDATGGGGGGTTPSATPSRTPTASPTPSVTRSRTGNDPTVSPSQSRTTPPVTTTAPSPTASPTASPTTPPTTPPATTPPVTTPAPTTPAPTVSPDGPGNQPALRITETTTSSARLSWDAAEAGTRYTVAMNDRTLGSVRSTSVRVTGMRPDTEYRFQILTTVGGRLTPYTGGATVRTAAITTPAGGSRPVTVRNVLTGGFAELLGVRAADGTPLVLARPTGATNQRWTLEPAGTGYLLRSQATGKCVEPLRGAAPAAGTPLVQYPCDAATATQVWRTVTTPFGLALTTGDDLVIGVQSQRFAGDRVLALQRANGARFQSWAVQPA